jgi:hypothetical protein
MMMPTSTPFSNKATSIRARTRHKSAGSLGYRRLRRNPVAVATHDPRGEEVASSLHSSQ